jgi:DNA polymerase-3 subunit chi
VSLATEITFYHLTKWPLERALPKLLERALAQNHKVVVRVPNTDRLAAFNQALWTYDPGSFLPHGVARDGNSKHQPVYLTTGSDVPNEATLLILTGGTDSDDIGRFTRCFDIFEGDERSVVNAEKRWALRSVAGYSQTYWQQAVDGRWEKCVKPEFSTLNPAKSAR